jgi:hypothetical protein
MLGCSRRILRDLARIQPVTAALDSPRTPETREIFGAGASSSGMPDLLETFRPAGQIPEVQLLGARDRTPGRPVPSALAFIGRG